MKITITGPRSVGKTTISKIVAKKLKLRRYSSDEIGEEHLKKHGGLDKAIKSRIADEFIKNSAYNLIREVYKKDNFVFDLSGGAVTSRKFAEVSEKVRKMAKENSIVIGLLPSKNIKESVEFLFEREKNRSHFKEINSEELRRKTEDDYKKFSPLLKKFCDFIIYVKGKSPKGVMREIIGFVNNRIVNIFLVRHGESLANSKKISQGNRDRWEDTSLTRKGKEQAKKVAERLMREKIDLIYSSDLKRAKETAEIINKFHNVRIKFDKRLRDMLNDENLEEFIKRCQGSFKDIEKENKNVLVIGHGSSVLTLLAISTGDRKKGGDIVRKHFKTYGNTCVSVIERCKGKYRIKLVGCRKHLE